MFCQCSTLAQFNARQLVNRHGPIGPVRAWSREQDQGFYIARASTASPVLISTFSPTGPHDQTNRHRNPPTLYKISHVVGDQFSGVRCSCYNQPLEAECGSVSIHRHSCQHCHEGSLCIALAHGLQVFDLEHKLKLILSHGPTMIPPTSPSIRSQLPSRQVDGPSKGRTSSVDVMVVDPKHSPSPRTNSSAI